MKKDEIMENLKKKCENLIKIHKNDKKKMLIFTTISSILKDGCNFFQSCDADTAINILLDLGYEKEEAKKIYLTLLT